MLVSILVIAYNEENYIKRCISSILAQTHKEFELIIVDDGSTDKTIAVTERFKDSRIKILSNIKNKGYAVSRNRGVQHSKGKIIFFTDADCVVSRDWLEQGLEAFETNKNIAGVRGLCYYVSQGYKPSIGERCRTISNKFSNATRNIAYYKEQILNVGGFSLRYNNGCEDIELGLRVSKNKRIIDCRKMVVFHQKKYYKLSMIPEQYMAIKSVVYLKKDYPYADISRKYFLGRICYPALLVAILIPPFLLLYLWMHKLKIKSLGDLRYIPYNYIWAIYIRILIWKTAIEERIFII